MIAEQKRLIDGLEVAVGGIDSARDPSLLNPAQLSFAVNVTLRDGYPLTRPGFEQLGLTFQSEEQADWFFTHILQGAGYYNNGDYPVFVVSVGGRIFRLDILNAFKVSEVTPESSTTTTALFTVPAIGASVTISLTNAARVWVGYPIRVNGASYLVTGRTGNTVTATNLTDTAVSVASGALVAYLDVNPPDRPQAWIEQAGDWAVVQDGLSRPILFNGSRSQRAGPTQVPTGTMMAYGFNRLWVAINRFEFVAGDIEGGPTEPIDFTENTYLNEGGAFRVPKVFGEIRALKFIATLDTSLGQGPLLVFQERSIVSCNAPTNREEWKNLTDPIQTIANIEYGSMGAVALVNGDVFFRSRDGLRSFILARRDFGTWGNTPISRELRRIMRHDTPRLLKHFSLVLFDNRILFTISPQPTANGVKHRCLGVLDFDLLASIGEKAPPVYEGIWTGIDPTLLVKGTFDGRERAFAFALNADNRNELWEFTEDRPFDNSDGRVASWIETKGLDNGSPYQLKRLEDCDLWADRIMGDVDLDLKYRPDQYPCWHDWRRGVLASKYRDCDSETDLCKTISDYRETYVPRYPFGQPPETIEDGLARAARNSHQFQLRLAWTGRLRVRKLIPVMKDVQETPHKRVDELPVRDICYLPLDGVNDYFKVAASANFRFTGSFTIELRVRPIGTGSTVVIAAQDDPAGAASPWFLAWTSGQTFSWGLKLSSGLVVVPSSLGFYNANHWYHVALTYDGTNLRMYIDGVQDSVVAATGTLLDSTGALSFGAGLLAGAPSDFFNGSISEVRLWNVARTLPEIANNRNRSLMLPETGLVGLWTFENGVLDSSGYNQNGTLLGGATVVCVAGDFLATEIQCCDLDVFGYRSNLADDSAGDTYPGVAAGKINPNCPDGYLWGGKGCVQTRSAQVCSTGYAWNGTNCVPST